MFETLRGIFTHNLPTKMLSLGIAVLLWSVVLGSRSVEVTKKVPLEVVTKKNLVVSSDYPGEISFRLSGPKAFLRAILDRSEKPIQVNLTSAKPGLVTYRFFSDNIRVPIGVKVLSINPTSILFRIEKVVSKKVPIRLSIQGDPRPGYKLVKTELSGETIEIFGASSKVEAVTEVVTRPVDISKVRGKEEGVAPLDLATYGVQSKGKIPNYSIEVTPASANFRIRNVPVRIVSKRKGRLARKSVTVFVRASSEDLKTLDHSRVFAKIDLKARPKGKYREKVAVTVPDNIGFVKVVPERIDVTLY